MRVPLPEALEQPEALGVALPEEDLAAEEEALAVPQAEPAGLPL